VLYEEIDKASYDVAELLVKFLQDVKLPGNPEIDSHSPPWRAGRSSAAAVITVRARIAWRFQFQALARIIVYDDGTIDLATGLCKKGDMVPRIGASHWQYNYYDPKSFGNIERRLKELFGKYF